MYHLYVCVYVPHNDQLGQMDFPHNALSPQCIVGTYVRMCVCVCAKDCTVLMMKKIDNSNSFDRTWDEFKAGFGNTISGNYWLGNDRIHQLTKDGGYMLLVDIKSKKGFGPLARFWSDYARFIVGSEATNYQVLIDGGYGKAGDPIGDINGTQFTTNDRDNDGNPTGNCAVAHSGGFWYNSNDCASCSLTAAGSSFNCMTLPERKRPLDKSQMRLRCKGAK